jgi:hypothetical protein
VTNRPFSYYDLLESFQKPGCAICNLLSRDVERFLDSLLYEYVTEPDTQQAFRAGRGFCNEHSWQLTHFRGRVVGIAMLFEAAVDEVLNISEQVQATGLPPSALSRLLNKLGDASIGRGVSPLSGALEPTGACIVCELLAQSEKDYVLAMGQHIADASLATAYRGSHGLCLPHFRQALREIRDAAHQDLFISIQIVHWRKLKAELGEFIRKNDFNYADEAIGAEGDSWLRAIRQLGGEKGIFGLSPRAT